jgi:hypothetical protein
LPTSPIELWTSVFQEPIHPIALCSGTTFTAFRPDSPPEAQKSNDKVFIGIAPAIANGFFCRYALTLKSFYNSITSHEYFCH